MDNEALADLDRIKRYSRSLRRLFMLLFFVTLLGGCVTLIALLSGLSADHASGAAASIRRTIELNGTLTFDWNAASMTVRTLAIAYVAAVFTVALMLLRHLAKLFGLYAVGKIFTGENVREIRLIGVMLMLFSLSWIIALPIPMLLESGTSAAQADSVAGSQIAASPELSLSPFFTGLIVIFISWVMDIGRRLREENDLVV